MTRVSLIGTLAVLACFPVIARAELILTGGNQYIVANGGVNFFGNLSSDTKLFGGDDIRGFPSSGSATAMAVAATTSLNFLNTQVGDVATFTQTISQFQAGVENGQSEHRFSIEFIAVNDLAFTFTSNWNGLGTAGTPLYSAVLLDKGPGGIGNVFSDNSLDPNDLNPVENHTGFLIAGHSYSLIGGSGLFAGLQGTGVPASASATFVFTTSAINASPVPEPGSLLLLGTGALSLILVGAARRFAKR